MLAKKGLKVVKKTMLWRAIKLEDMEFLLFLWIFLVWLPRLVDHWGFCYNYSLFPLQPLFVYLYCILVDCVLFNNALLCIMQNETKKIDSVLPPPNTQMENEILAIKNQLCLAKFLHNNSLGFFHFNLFKSFLFTIILTKIAILPI